MHLLTWVCTLACACMHPPKTCMQYVHTHNTCICSCGVVVCIECSRECAQQRTCMHVCVYMHVHACAWSAARRRKYSGSEAKRSCNRFNQQPGPLVAKQRPLIFATIITSTCCVAAAVLCTNQTRPSVAATATNMHFMCDYAQACGGGALIVSTVQTCRKCAPQSTYTRVLGQTGQVTKIHAHTNTPLMKAIMFKSA